MGAYPNKRQGFVRKILFYFRFHSHSCTMNLESLANPVEGHSYQTINRETGLYIAARYNPFASVEQRFKTWWRSFVEYYLDHPFDLIYMEQITNSSMYDVVGRDESARYYLETREIIRAGQEQGQVREGEITLLNQFVRVSLVNVVKLNFSRGRKLKPEEIDLLVDLSWSAIKAG